MTDEPVRTQHPLEVLYEAAARWGIPVLAEFFLATCQDCTPVLPQPFYVERERDEWADAHAAATGHEVLRLTMLE